jgi:hypothetical protein
MTNPTTPFSWQMPTASDLVTDLPADFETFGQAVATSMADLLGGTTGQVLSKASNTDMDFTWVAQDDSNAIQNAIVDAKGDLIAASAADTPARLAVGANGTTLVADSTAATGLAWAKSPNFVGCILYKNADQSVANATGTAITYDTEFIDTDAFHDNSTNPSRITIPTGLGGKYQFNATITWQSNSVGVRFTNFYKNGFLIGQLQGTLPNASFDQPVTGSMIFFGVPGDYFEVYGYQSSGGALNAKGGGSFATSILSAQFLGA